MLLVIDCKYKAIQKKRGINGKSLKAKNSESKMNGEAKQPLLIIEDGKNLSEIKVRNFISAVMFNCKTV